MLEPARTSTPSALDPDTAALQEAVQRAKNRDHAAFELLYQHYKSLIWKRLTYLVGTKEIVYDLFQETFLRAWNKLPELRNEGQFEPWLKRIAANQAIDYLRHEKKYSFSRYQKIIRTRKPLLFCQGFPDQRGISVKPSA